MNLNRRRCCCCPEAAPSSGLQTGGASIQLALARLLDRRLVPLDDLVAISCTTQWGGTVAVDQNLQPLMNAIVWLDARGAPYIDRLAAGTLSIQGYDLWKLFTWLRLTGGVPTHSGKDSLAHILYLKHAVPDVYQAAAKFLEPKDYLNARLTGRCAATHDSITLHWVTDNRRIDHIDYDLRLLKLAQIDREQLPDLCRAIDILGPIKPEVADESGAAPADFPSSAALPIFFQQRSDREPCAITKRICIWGLRRGWIVMCPSNNLTCCTTWPRCRRPCPAAIYWAPSRNVPGTA